MPAGWRGPVGCSVSGGSADGLSLLTLNKGFVVGGGIDSDGGMVDDGDSDACSCLQRSQLFQFFHLFKGDGGSEVSLSRKSRRYP